MPLEVGQQNFRVLAIADAREMLDQLSNRNSNLSPVAVWDIGIRVVQMLKTDLCLQDTVESREWKDLEDKLKDLHAAVEKTGDNVSQVSPSFLVRVRSTIVKRSRTTATRRMIASISELSSIIKADFLEELQNLPVCLVTPRRPPPEDWRDVRKLFRPREDVFDSLPLVMQRDLQEAGWCFLFDQFTACSVMAMRAAEASLRGYVQSALSYELKDKDVWSTLVSMIDAIKPPVSKSLRQSLQLGNVQRNDFAHPSKRVEDTDWDEAVFTFDLSKRIVIDLYDDLHTRHGSTTEE